MQPLTGWRLSGLLRRGQSAESFRAVLATRLRAWVGSVPIKTLALIAALPLVMACTVGEAGPGIASATPTAGPSRPPSRLLPLKLWNPTHGRAELQLVDVATGQPASGTAPIVVSRDSQFQTVSAFADDGRWLALMAADGSSCEAMAGGVACRGNAAELHLIDLPRWQDRAIPLSTEGWVSDMVFSPDGTRLVLALHEGERSQLVLVETASGQLLRRQTVDLRPSLIAFGRDGAELVVFGQAPGAAPGTTQPPAPRLLLMETPSLALRWDQPLPAVLSGSWCEQGCAGEHADRVQTIWQPAAVIAPDGRSLMIVHAEADRLTIVDLIGRTIRTSGPATGHSWLQELIPGWPAVAEAKGVIRGTTRSAMITPDGTRLIVASTTLSVAPATTSQPPVTVTDHHVQVIEVATGRSLARQPAVAGRLHLMPDGISVHLTGWSDDQPLAELLSIDTLRSIRRLPGWTVAFGRGLDGLPISVASQLTPQGSEAVTRLAVLDPATLSIVATWSAPSTAEWIVRP